MLSTTTVDVVIVNGQCEFLIQFCILNVNLVVWYILVFCVSKHLATLDGTRLKGKLAKSATTVFEGEVSKVSKKLKCN
jgi:hypothetical protein